MQKMLVVLFFTCATGAIVGLLTIVSIVILLSGADLYVSRDLLTQVCSIAGWLYAICGVMTLVCHRACAYIDGGSHALTGRLPQPSRQNRMANSVRGALSGVPNGLALWHLVRLLFYPATPLSVGEIYPIVTICLLIGIISGVALAWRYAHYGWISLLVMLAVLLLFYSSLMG